MSEQQLTAADIIADMPNHFHADKAGSTSASVQFDLTGDQAGRYWIRIDNGTATSGEGDVESPNLTMTVSGDDWVRISTGAMDATAAFMQGKLKIKGDMGLAIKFQTMFKRS